MREHAAPTRNPVGNVLGPLNRSILQRNGLHLLPAHQDRATLRCTGYIEQVQAILRFPESLASEQIQAMKLIRFDWGQQHAAIGDRDRGIGPAIADAAKHHGVNTHTDPAIQRFRTILISPQQRAGRHIDRHDRPGRGRTDQNPVGERGGRAGRAASRIQPDGGLVNLRQLLGPFESSGVAVQDHQFELPGHFGQRIELSLQWQRWAQKERAGQGWFVRAILITHDPPHLAFRLQI